MTTETILVERQERVAVLTFDRPKVLNAFDAKLVGEMR
jgi:enoyl-CoA hydratase/carnithine racemase